MPRRTDLLGSLWLLAVVAGGASAQQTQPAAGAAIALEARAVALKRISAELICQCSCNMILAECSHQSCPFALPEREKILARIDAGDSDEMIIAGYVRDYGRSILSAPPTDGSLLDRAAWWMPVVALLIGAVLAGYFTHHFTQAGSRRALGEVDPGAAVDGPLGDDYRARIERELRGPKEGS